MTQTDLASAAGIALSVLQAIEQGKSDPKLSTVIALLDALKAQGVELLAGSESVAWGVYVAPGSPAAARGNATTRRDGAATPAQAPGPAAREVDGRETLNEVSVSGDIVNLPRGNRHERPLCGRASSTCRTDS